MQILIKFETPDCVKNQLLRSTTRPHQAALLLRTLSRLHWATLFSTQAPPNALPLLAYNPPPACNQVVLLLRFTTRPHQAALLQRTLEVFASMWPELQKTYCKDPEKMSRDCRPEGKRVWWGLGGKKRCPMKPG